MGKLLSILTVVYVGVLTGCSSVSEVKAPCDYYGTFCGQKIHINQ